jgi:hypothetical protein
MNIIAGIFILGVICLGVWVLIEHVVDKMFDKDDLGDSDYGC